MFKFSCSRKAQGLIEYLLIGGLIAAITIPAVISSSQQTQEMIRNSAPVRNPAANQGNNVVVSSNPNLTASNETTSNETTSNETTSNETASNETTSNETTSNETTSNEVASNETTSSETVSNETTGSSSGGETPCTNSCGYVIQERPASMTEESLVVPITTADYDPDVPPVTVADKIKKIVYDHLLKSSTPMDRNYFTFVNNLSVVEYNYHISKGLTSEQALAEVDKAHDSFMQPLPGFVTREQLMDIALNVLYTDSLNDPSVVIDGYAVVGYYAELAFRVSILFSNLDDAVNDYVCNADAPTRRDPYTVNINNEEYMFVQDKNGDGKFNDASELLGFNDTDRSLFNEMAGLDTNNDNVVTSEELKAGRVKLLKKENGILTATEFDLASISRIDLTSFKESADNKDGIGTFGTFDVVLTDEATAAGKVTFDLLSVLESLFDFIKNIFFNIL